MRSWKLGRAFGINIYVHWTFLLIVGLVLYQNWNIGGADQALFGVIVLFAAFGCVVLHELGHALMARRFGIPTRDITLYPIGGVARLERMSERPWEEFCIAVAGPAVNVVIAAVLAVPAILSMRVIDGAPDLLHRNFVLALFLVNLVLVLFNMVPAFPMDGGRVLRALLVNPLGRVRATQVAATLGAVFALVLVLFGFLPALFGQALNPVLPVIGMFVFMIGRQELALVRYQERLRRSEPVDVLPVDSEVLDVIPVNRDDHFSGSVWDQQRRLCVIWRNGRPVYSYRLD